MRLNGDALNDLVFTQGRRERPGGIDDATARHFCRDNTNDSGPGSLRQEILDANASAGWPMRSPSQFRGQV
jgi:hypothetical protein